MLLWMTMASAAWACEDVEPLPESLQVAWISPVDKTVRGGTWLEVVRVRDLRRWVRANSADPARVLAAMGMIERGESLREEYKITIFDVQSAWLCRPISEGVPGEDVLGAPVCEERADRPVSRQHSDGFTGCGYSLDTYSSVRGLDVYRVQWSEASAWGFCVLPIGRFLEGA